MTDERYRTAIHEAGHAFAAMRLGIMFESVTIKRESGSLGSVQNDDWYCPEDRSDAVKYAMQAFAGGVAEIAAGFDVERAMTGAASDIDAAEDYLREAFKRDKERSIRRGRAHRKTVKLFRRPETFAIVEALAAALMEKETLTFKEALNIATEEAKKGSAK